MSWPKRQPASPTCVHMCAGDCLSRMTWGTPRLVESVYLVGLLTFWRCEE
jgi:hypothetical protein